MQEGVDPFESFEEISHGDGIGKAHAFVRAEGRAGQRLPLHAVHRHQAGNVPENSLLIPVYTIFLLPKLLPYAPLTTSMQ